MVQEFAVGVVSKNGEYRLIDSGPLPEAVAASAAIPFVFEPVAVPGDLNIPHRATFHISGGHLDYWTMLMIC